MIKNKFNISFFNAYLSPTPFIPFLCLLIIILTVPITKSVSFGFGRMFLVEGILFLFCFVYFLVLAVTREFKKLYDIEILLSIIPFLIAAALSVIFNMGDIHRKMNVVRAAGLIIRWMELPLAFMLASNIVRSKRALKAVIVAYILAAFFMCLYVLRGYIYAFGIKFFYGLSKALSPSDLTIYSGAKEELRIGWAASISPNMLAAYLNAVLPLAIAMYYYFRNIFKKSLMGVVIAIQIVILFVTSSRSALLGFLSGVGLWLVYIRKKVVTLLVPVIILSILFTAVFFGSMKNKLSKISSKRINVSSIAVGLSERFSLQKHAFKVFLTNPLFGVGVGHWKIVGDIWGLKKEEIQKSWDRYPKVIGYYKAHNIYLQILAETGIFGFITFMYFLFILWKHTIISVRLQRNYEFYNLISTALLCTYVIFLLHNLFDYTMGHGLGIQLGLNLGLVSAMKRAE